MNQLQQVFNLHSDLLEKIANVLDVTVSDLTANKVKSKQAATTA